jgi:adenylyltransferase/sulfurtransferase
MQNSVPDRYSRQVLFSGLGEQGQQRLLESRVAIVGCGALGSFHAGALARAGVGFLTIIDRDYVEWSNLQRQWLFTESDAAEGIPKAIAAARAIAEINSGVQADPIIADLVPANVEEFLSEADLVLDGTDNFETRYLINDWCVSRGVPWVYGAAVASHGVTMPVLPGKSACLKCMFPVEPSGAHPTCETAGVLNAITSAIASLQVGDALRILSGAGAALRITSVDVWNGTIRQIQSVERSPGCQCCGKHEFVHLSGESRPPVSLCGRNAVQIHERRRPVNLVELDQLLSPLGQVRRNEFALRFFSPPYEMTVFPDGRAIIKGTTDPGLARSLYARYIGT